MSTKRETILVALHAYLVTAVPTLSFVRNPALDDIIENRAIALRDGSAEQTEEFFNGPIYEFTMTPSLILILEKGDDDLDAGVDEAADLVAVALEAAGDLGGLVTGIRVQPLNTDVQETFGAADLKGAEIAIEIDYWSDRSVG